MADEAVAGAVEAIAAYTVLAIQRLGQGVAVGVFGQGLVEGGVEHHHLRQIGEQLEGGLDALQVGWIVQRGERRGVADRREHRGVDALRLGEAFATVHHPVADAMQLAASGTLHHG